MEKDKKGYVYLLCDSGQDNLFKIGVTTGSIEKRIKKLQTGNGNEIFLVNYYLTDYPFTIEHMLHQKYSPSKKLNEWFTLEPDATINFKQHCQECETILDSLKDNPFMNKKLK